MSPFLLVTRKAAYKTHQNGKYHAVKRKWYFAWKTLLCPRHLDGSCPTAHWLRAAVVVIRARRLTDPKRYYQGLCYSATRLNEKLSHSPARNRWQAGSRTHLPLHHPGRSMGCTGGLSRAAWTGSAAAPYVEMLCAFMQPLLRRLRSCN